MKKANLFAASIAAMSLVGCASEDYVGVVDNPTGDGIGFGSGVTATTRATSTGSQAAEKLNNNFIVYGFKTNALEEADGSTDQTVFDLYNVNYAAGTAGTTESNTANWEYVGFAPHTGSRASEQSIKYWDMSANQYVFSAVSGTGIKASKIESATSSKYDKGWKIELPAGGSLSDLYASDRKPVDKADYKKQVDLTFRALTAKIRFAMYEIVPGYKVHINKFYFNTEEDPSEAPAWENTTTNFAIDGTFKTTNESTPTKLTVTYYDDSDPSVENRPKVSFVDSDVTTSVYGTFGANIQATEAIGTTSAGATYDQSDKSYTMILPFEDPENKLELYVDYTLTSTDGSGEEIKVWHASAKVPANFCQWKPNFAYTYIFKISDNTNGATGDPGDGDNPFDPDDPTDLPDDELCGLWPITFDAVVITNETDVQETITSVSEASITTYQDGIVVTENNEYKAGDIYLTVMDRGSLVTLVGGNSAVYEVNENTPNTFETLDVMSEEVVANYLNNYCTLTKVQLNRNVTEVPCSDGSTIKFVAGTVGKFNAKAGKLYVVRYKKAADKYTYKLIRVVGNASAPTYSLSAGGSTALSAVNATATLTLTADDVEVLGAKPVFKITSTNGNNALKVVDGTEPGEYTVSIDQDAIKAGKANDTYKVSFGDKSVTITVEIEYALDAASVNIAAGNTTGATTTLKIAGSAADGDVTEVPAGITIENTATGTYKVTAAATVTPGSYTAKIAGVELTINVDGYTFLDSRTFTLDYEGNADQQTLYLTKNNNTEYADVEVSAMTGINESVAQIIKANAGIYAVVPMGPGSYTVTYENASAVITVNQFTLTSSETSIAKSTESAVLTLKKNNGETKTVNASTSNVTVYKGSVVDANKVTTGFSLTTNGQTMKFGNVAEANTYIFHYTEDGKVVAQVTITVTE